MATLFAVILSTASTGLVEAQAPVILPAGAQFPDAPEQLPEGFLLDDPALVAERAGTVVVLGRSGQTGQRFGDVAVAVRDPAGSWSTVIVDDQRRLPAPRGLRHTEGFLPVAIAAGPSGFVALARTTYKNCSTRCRQVGERGQVHSLIWTSADGTAWRRVDPRDALGTRTTIALRAVTATIDGTWLVAGSTADFRRPSRIAMLRSDDGIRWRPAGTIDGPRSLEPMRFHHAGDTTLLAGLEMVCSRDSGHHGITSQPAGETVFQSRIQQLRLWTPIRNGEQWRPVDLAASGVIEAPPRSSLRRRDCDGFDLATVQRVSGSGVIVGGAGGSLVAISGDGTRAAVTSDLEHWTATDLPGALPANERSADRRIAALAVAPVPGGGVGLSTLELRRDDSDRVVGRAHQVITWQTDDAGVSWRRLPATRPFIVDPGGRSMPIVVAALRVQDDDRIVLLARPADGSSTGIRWSEAGPLDPWGTCDPAPSADCRFAQITTDMAGADLTGIDLTGATVTADDWRGVDLRGASLASAAVLADLTGADLRDARAAGLQMLGDHAGSSIAGADLRDASFSLDLLAGDTTGIRLQGARFQVPLDPSDDVHLAGRDLTGAWFTGVSSTERSDLRGVDLRDTRLDGAWFGNVDLTGARLKGARFRSLVLIDVICPDGKPADAATYGIAACRLKAR